MNSADSTRVAVAFTPALLPPKSTWKERSVVVIDTLRASTTIIAALAAGAEAVIPCETPEQAARMAEEFEATGRLLAGERDSVKIEGFDLGNSPLEFTPNVVRQKKILLTTTNGTRAFRAVSDADLVLCGSLRNADAVAAACREAERDVLLLCAGTGGRFSLEDTIAAGAIIDALKTFDQRDLEPDDASVAAYEAFDLRRADLRAALEATMHGKRLLELGFADDVAYSAERSVPGAGTPRLFGPELRLR